MDLSHSGAGSVRAYLIVSIVTINTGICSVDAQRNETKQNVCKCAEATASHHLVVEGFRSV